MNTYQTGSWFIQNQNWLIPLGITIIFSIINIVFACINVNHTKKQNEAQQIGLGVTLMQKRLAIYELEQKLLEAIINHSKPGQPLLEESCKADIEIRYLFGSEISEHFRKVIDLTDKACEYTPEAIPDGYGGYFTNHKDFEMEEDIIITGTEEKI